MLKPLFAASVLAFVCTAAVAQETQAPAIPPQAADMQTVPPPAVETMTCEQMNAEMMEAGRRMSAQMDPEFSTEAQAMYEEAQRSRNSAVAQGVGTSIACSIPGVGMACMAAQQAQAARAQQEQQEHMARMDAQMQRLQSSMQGIDQQRMMQITNRHQQMGCQTPQQ